MKSILYITANPKKEENSSSLSVGRVLLETYRSLQPESSITEIDVFRQPIPLIDEHFVSARQKISSGMETGQLLLEEREILDRIDRLTSQFIAADLYIFAYPLWNFGVPPLLKAYVDTIKVARRTFRYTPEGPEGLLRNKTAVLIQSSGDVYTSGPLQAFEHGSRYLASVLTFIGVERIETVYMEGMDKYRDEAAAIQRRAIDKVKQIAPTI